MVILFDAAKVQQLLDIRKSFCKYFYFYGDFIDFLQFWINVRDITQPRAARVRELPLVVRGYTISRGGRWFRDLGR
jgi:hypothetical protein